MLWTRLVSSADQRLAGQYRNRIPAFFTPSLRNPTKAFVILLAFGVVLASAMPAQSQNPSPQLATEAPARQQVSELAPDVKRVACCTTTTTLTSSLNPAIKGQNVLFTARVVASNGAHPGGNINFYLDGTLFVTRALTNGVAAFGTAGLPVGTMSFTAICTGATGYDSSSSQALVQSVHP